MGPVPAIGPAPIGPIRPSVAAVASNPEAIILLAHIVFKGHFEDGDGTYIL
jgi:hypothetical protein